ncbi:hypothetical protein BJV82DRAFT_578868 [Fennellomyces sp. T-0311]|nr:hypothetical protein BJV82DRAFT_578868 [Fennellomyces sp. T-0311]
MTSTTITICGEEGYAVDAETKSRSASLLTLFNKIHADIFLCTMPPKRKAQPLESRRSKRVVRANATPESTPEAFDDLFAQGNHSTVIDNASNEIDELTKQLIHSLDARARALGETEKYDEAHKDALKMISLAPTSQLGYARAGSLYQKQGNRTKAVAAYLEGIAALKRDKKAVEYFENAIKELNGQADNDAVGLAKVGRFPQALEMAREMIETNPTSADAYLCTAEIYMLQCKPQMAVRACAAGLKKAKKTDPQYKALTPSKKRAEEQQEIKVDFVERLPADVLELIFSRVEAEQRLLCMSVSKIWKQRIAQSAGAWRELVLNTKTPLAPLDPMLAHVNHFTIYSHDTANVVRSYDVLLDNKVKNVQTLNFYVNNHVPATNRFDRIFHRFENTLTTLTLNQHGTSPKRTLPSVGWILSRCPELADLTYESQHLLSTKAQKTGFPRTSKLKRLRLRAMATRDGGRISDAVFKAIGKCCTQLVYLDAEKCDVSSIDVIKQEFKELKQLYFNTSNFRFKPLPKSNGEEQGLTVVTFKDNARTQPDGDRHVVPLILDNQSTLRKLVLTQSTVFTGFSSGFTPGPTRADAWQALTNFHGSQLRKLVIHVKCKQEYVTSVINHAPKLESINIQDYATNSTMEAVGNLQHLRKLKLFKHSDELTTAGLTSLFSRLAENNTIECLSLHSVWNLKDEALVKIASINSLQSVNIEECDYISANGLKRLFATVIKNKQSSLVRMDLICLEMLTDAAVKGLVAIKNLKTISIDYAERLTDQGGKMLAEWEDQPGEFRRKLYLSSSPKAFRAAQKYYMQKRKKAASDQSIF